MTFLHKLAQRLARMKTSILMGVVLTSACEQIPAASLTGTQAPVAGTSVASVKVFPGAISATTGQSVQLTAIPLDSNGSPVLGRTVSWKSSDSTIVKVNGNGVAKGAPAGKTTIIATVDGKSGDAAITVTETPAPVASMSLIPALTNVAAGYTAQLAATLKDASGNVLIGRVITWGSNNLAVATVSGSGMVTGVAAGSATITATSEGKSATAGIGVSPPPAPVASVTVTPAVTSIAAGSTGQLTAILKDASGNLLLGRVITWSSNNLAVATVSGSGMVNGVAAGSVTITATSEGRNGTAAVTVTQTSVPVASVTVAPALTSVIAGSTVQLTATLKDASGNILVGRVVTWGSSNTGVATILGPGLVTGLAVGSATITATSEGRNGASAISVAAPPPPGAWPNEPAGMTLISDYSFDDLLPIAESAPIGTTGWSINNQLANATRMSDATAPSSPMNVMQYKYPMGMLDGGGPANMYRQTGGGRELYVGFWWKASKPFHPHASGVDKIAFTWSQSNMLSYINMQGTSEPYSITIHDAPLGNGQTLAPNVTTTPVMLGVWHRIELYQKYSTTASSNDGIIRWWVDGVLNGNYTNLNFVQDAGWGEFQIASTFGGCCGETKAGDDYYWFDQIHLSRR